jgi:ATP-dependent RNA helicase DDX49/DBP8
VPKQRQTLLFSATITDALNKLHQVNFIYFKFNSILSKVSVRKPFFFEEKDDIKTVDQLEQRFVLCPRAVKDAYLVYVVKEVAKLSFILYQINL